MTTTLPLIRIVDDDEELRNSQKMLLASLGWSVKTYESALAFLSDDELTRPVMPHSRCSHAWHDRTRTAAGAHAA